MPGTFLTCGTTQVGVEHGSSPDPIEGQRGMMARALIEAALGSLVVSRLRGGLGNQLFQYAAGLSIARSRRARHQLDTVTGFAKDLRYMRSYALDYFRITATMARPEAVRAVRCICGPLSFIQREFDEFRRQRAGACYGAILTWPGLPLYLDGYWQSYRYFSDVAGELRTELVPRTVVDASTLALLEHINETESVALHVRRQDFPHCLSMEYYGSAIAKLPPAEARRSFFLFGDDTEWLRALACRFLRGSKWQIVERTPRRPDAEDLWLMRCCQHHILSNSTFAWWSGWLALPGGAVIVPSNGWSVSQSSLPDLIPAHWVVVDE